MSQLQAKPFIATPCYDGSMSHRYTSSIAGTAYELGKHGVEYVHKILSCYDTPIARNILLAEFLASDCTHLVFIDADMGWQPESFRRLLVSGHEVCCGVYPRKTNPTGIKKWTFNPMPGSEADVRTDPRTGFHEIKECGTGFLCIARSAAERIVAACPERRVILGDDVPIEHSYWIFSVEPSEGSLASEDYVFCRLWKKLGGEIWADPECFLDHAGHHVWHGGLGELMVPLVRSAEQQEEQEHAST